MYYSFFWGRSIRNILIERHCFYVALKQIANIYFYRRKKSWLLSLFLSSSTILNWLWISFLAIQQSCNLSSTLSYKRKKKQNFGKKQKNIVLIVFVKLRTFFLGLRKESSQPIIKHRVLNIKKLSSQYLVSNILHN